MRRFIFMLLASVFLFTGIAVAGEVTITLEWDANTETNLAGYGAYVGDAPGGPYTKWGEVAAGIETIDYVYDAPDGSANIKYFVVDAFNTNGLRSDKSNEVNYTYDMLPIVAATGFAAILDEDDIVFTWEQADIGRVKRWKLYVKEGVAEFSELATIDYTGQAGPQYSTTETMDVLAGEKKTFIFSLVTFTETGIFSPNSAEVSVTIDKIAPVPVYNLTIKVKVQ